MVGIGALPLRMRDEHLHEEASLRIVLAGKVMRRRAGGLACETVAVNLEAQKLQPVDLAIRCVGVSCCILPPDAFCLCFTSAGWTAPLVLLTGVLQVCAGGWLESARCPCAYVMNICMRSPACALFSQPRSRQWAGVVSHGVW